MKKLHLISELLYFNLVSTVLNSSSFKYKFEGGVTIIFINFLFSESIEKFGKSFSFLLIISKSILTSLLKKVGISNSISSKLSKFKNIGLTFNSIISTLLIKLYYPSILIYPWDNLFGSNLS